MRGPHSSMMVRVVPSNPCLISPRSHLPVNAIIFLAPISTFDQVLAEVSSLLDGPFFPLNRSEGPSCESPGRLTVVVEIDRVQQTPLQRKHHPVLEQMR